MNCSGRYTGLENKCENEETQVVENNNKWEKNQDNVKYDLLWNLKDRILLGKNILCLPVANVRWLYVVLTFVHGYNNVCLQCKSVCVQYISLKTFTICIYNIKISIQYLHIVVVS